MSSPPDPTGRVDSAEADAQDFWILDDQRRRVRPEPGIYQWMGSFRDGRAPCCRGDGEVGFLDREGRFHPGDAKSEAWLRKELTRIARLIYEKHYNASIDGNLSARLPDGTILITPTGQHNGFVDASQLVLMDIDGEPVGGSGRASSEKILHLEVYRTRPDVGAVIHSHAPNAIAASLAGIDLMETLISVAPVPTTAYARPSSAESAERMRPFIEEYDWAILPRHGVVTLGRTPWDAFLRLEGLEHLAHIVLVAHATGRPITPLTSDRRAALLDFWNLGPEGEHRR